MEKRNPTQHRMTRRAAEHDYSASGIYHITMHVAESWGQPLGAVVGDLHAPEGSADAPRVALTRVGEMVEHELLTAIPAYYPMIEIQDYVIMPEHLHFIIEAHGPIVTQRGKRAVLGQVLAGFKKGCNRQFWAIIEETHQGKPDGTNASSAPTVYPLVPPAPAALAPAGPAAPTVGAPVALAPAASVGAPALSAVAVGAPAVSPLAADGAQATSAPYKVPSRAHSGRQPLFSEGFCDVMPLHKGQLATQRAYIKENPRSRLLRMSNRAQLAVRRGGIVTALTPAALRGYLQRECPPYLATPEALAAIEGHLLLANGYIACDSYGDRALLMERRCLPVVCHRCDAARFGEQKARCLDEAAKGIALVSARISPKEREIIDESVNRGFPTIVIHDNGFTDRYHPSAESLALCAAGHLLLVSPWKYQYRGKDEQVTVPFCKAMNCVAQALCRTKDNWWRNKE